MGVRAALLAVGSLSLGCSVPETDYTGKECPCPTSYQCDGERGVCVKAVDLSTAGAIDIASFRPDWVAPNMIRWSFEPTGVAGDLLRYEISIATSAANLAAGTDVVVFGPAQNPELGRFELPFTGGSDELRGTITDGLVEDTEYFAELVAYDTQSGFSKSNVASARTSIQPFHEKVIMADALVKGTTLPACYQSSTVSPYAGSAAYAYVSACAPGDVAQCGATGGNICWEYLRFFQLGLAPTAPSEIDSDGTFASAFLEFAIAFDGSAPAFYSEVRFRDQNDHKFYVKALSYRPDGAYRVYQLPLRAFTWQDKPVTREIMFETPLVEVGVGANWTAGATVRIDEVRLRW